MAELRIAIIGGGPAGLAAAATAVDQGARVTLIDESSRLGGQIWRPHLEKAPAAARPWLRRLRRPNVEVRSATQVIDADVEAGTLATRGGSLHFDRLILATGARELLLPFPGWTLPGVTGAGGLQALVHGGFDVSGRRTVVAGSGPLLLQVAHSLKRHGARVVRVAEQAPWPRLLRFGRHLGGRRLRQALGLATRRFRTSSWPLAAHGRDRVEAVTLRRSGRSETLRCDALAVGFGLVPNLELPRLLGCREHAGGVWVDEHQRTSVAQVYAAGELTGICGAEGALVEGASAAHHATRTAIPPELLAARERERRFGQALARSFQLRDELRQLANAHTLVCRCEDVPKAALDPQPDWRSAKLHTRCGMGACQGRICGAAAEVLFGWQTSGSRPPLAPVPISRLIASSQEPCSFSTTVKGVNP